MSPADVAALVGLLKSLAPPLLEAAHSIIDALRSGEDPTPAVRHLEVQAAFELLGIRDK